MKYGEDVIKLFQEYRDRRIQPKGEYRIGVCKGGKIIAVYSDLKEALNETLKTEKLYTFSLICYDIWNQFGNTKCSNSTCC